jgi:hypothetical protein
MGEKFSRREALGKLGAAALGVGFASMSGVERLARAAAAEMNGGKPGVAPLTIACTGGAHYGCFERYDDCTSSHNCRFDSHNCLEKFECVGTGPGLTTVYCQGGTFECSGTNYGCTGRIFQCQVDHEGLFKCGGGSYGFTCKTSTLEFQCNDFYPNRFQCTVYTQC